MANKLITNSGTVVEDFESLTGWSIVGTGATKELDITNFRTGSGAIKLTTGVGVSATLQKNNLNMDFSTSANVRLSIYVYDKANTYSIALYLGNEATVFTNYFLWSSSTAPMGNFKTGWNEISIAKSQFTTGGGTPSWANPIQIMKVYNGPQAGKSSAITYDSLRAGYVSTPVVIVTFDDGWDGVYDEAYPIMAANGQKATTYIAKDWVGTAGHSTENQLKTLYAAGWDISNHSTSHVDLTTLDEAGIIDELEECYDYLYSLGFSTGIYHMAYPYGSVNDTVYGVVRTRFVTARTTQQPFGVQAFIEAFQDLPWYIKAFPVINTTTTTTIQTAIDRVIENCGLLVLLFHDIIDAAPTTYEYLTSNFQIISDYLKTKSDLGLLSIKTMDEYWRCFTPAGKVSVTLIGKTAEAAFTGRVAGITLVGKKPDVAFGGA